VGAYFLDFGRGGASTHLFAVNKNSVLSKKLNSKKKQKPKTYLKIRFFLGKKL